MLLDQAQGESLERLQLVSVDLELTPKCPNLDEQNIKRTSAGVDNFLILESTLSIDENSSAKIRVNYFIRGARKYFKTPVIPMLPHALIPVKKIECADLGQENSIFYDQALAELNGHPEIIVPSEAIIAWLVNYALGIWPEQRENLVFRLNFYAAVFVHQELSLGQELSENKLLIALYAGENTAVVLKAS